MRTFQPDNVLVDDLSGTDVVDVNTDLSLNGVSDGAADNVTVNATNGDDVVVVAGDANGTTVAGLPANVTITGASNAEDRVTIALYVDHVRRAKATRLPFADVHDGKLE